MFSYAGAPGLQLLMETFNCNVKVVKTGESGWLASDLQQLTVSKSFDPRKPTVTFLVSTKMEKTSAKSKVKEVMLGHADLLFPIPQLNVLGWNNHNLRIAPVSGVPISPHPDCDVLMLVTYITTHSSLLPITVSSLIIACL